MERDLTKGSVSSALLHFVLPFLAASVLQFLYSVVDMMVVGQFASPSGISAVNTAGQIMQLVTTVVQGIATGGTVLIAQYTGARARDSVRQTIGSIFWIFITLAIFLTLIMLVGNRSLIRISQVPEEAVEQAQSYLQICSVGIIFIAGYNGIAGILRGLGDSKHPMYFVACSCVLNIFGDLLLVGGFDMGVAGAAIATVFSQGVAFLLSVIVLQRSEYPICRGALRWISEKGTSVLKLGIPLAAQDFLTNLSFLLITIIVNGMGLNQSAAVGVVERIMGFCMLVPVAFLSALSAFVAQNVGADKPERAARGLKSSILLCALVTGAICVVVEWIPGTLISGFTSDMNVVKQGMDYIRTYCMDIFLVSFVFCLNGFYSGYGKTGFTMANCLISTFLVRVPLVFLVSRIPNVSLTMIGIAAPIASVIQILMQVIYFRVGSWRNLHFGTVR